MIPSFSDIYFVAILLCKVIHHRYSSRFIIIRADVHTLNARAFVIRKEFHLREICLLFLRCFGNSSVKINLCHKIRKTDYRDKMKLFFVSVINTFYAVLPPKSLQRRHDIIQERNCACTSIWTCGTFPMLLWILGFENDVIQIYWFVQLFGVSLNALSRKSSIASYIFTISPYSR